MTGFIYKITNTLNQKVYIGKTTTSLKERWEEHQLDAYRECMSNRPLYKAIRKYGISNFSIELIEECDISVLSNREIYWIETYHSFSNGYNATLGGDGKILYDYDLISDLLKQGLSTKDICNIVGCCDETVFNVAKRNNLPLNFTNNFCLKKQKVDQYTKTGEYIQSFNSYIDAARWLEEQGIVKGSAGSARSHIGEVCRGKRKTAYGYIWKNASIV